MNIIDNEKWRVCVNALTDKWLQRLAGWRGYTPEFCRWLREMELIGVYQNHIAFPVKDAAEAVVGIHYETDDGWAYSKGTKPMPLVIGDLTQAKSIYVTAIPQKNRKKCWLDHLNLPHGQA